jgi:hypothetical protein
MGGNNNYPLVPIKGIDEFFHPLNSEAVKYLFRGHEAGLEHFQEGNAEIHEDTSAELTDLLLGPIRITKLQVPPHQPSVWYSQRIEENSQQFS